MLSFNNTEIAFSNKSVRNLQRTYWMFKLIGNQSLVALGEKLTTLAIATHFPLKWFIKPTIFRHFCGGEDIEECGRIIEELGRFNIGTILDYSVEGKEEETVFDVTAEEIIKTINKASMEPHIPFSVFKITGIARFGLLEKLNNNHTLTSIESIEYNKIKERIDRICKTAFDKQIPVFIDAEESWIQDAIDSLAESMMRKYNREKAIVFNTIQLYRHDRLAFLKQSHEKALQSGYYLGVKLVRGAYMEKERARAIAFNYTSPIQPDKETTDKDYNTALEFCVENIDRIAICAGTHNEQSSLLLAQLMKKKTVQSNDNRIWFAQLLGMSDNISFNLAHNGYNAAKYVPYGPVNDVLPYLIRRAKENTSVKGQTGRELNLVTSEIKRRKQTEKITYGTGYLPQRPWRTD